MEYEYTPLLQKIADTSIRNQKHRVGDFVIDGITYCGTCGQPRQGYKTFASPTEKDPAHTTTLKMAIACACDQAEEKLEEEKRQARKDLEEIEKLRSVSLMDTRMREARFESFEVTRSNARNLKICRRYAENFDEMLQKNQGLVLWGDVGTGKSFAAACIANALLDRKYPVVMTSFVKLIAAMDADTSIGEQLINRLNAAKLLIFDDLGTERCTNAAIEKVYNIVDSRYRSKLPMIVTTNVTLEQMKSEMDIRYRRIYDRLFENCYPVQFVGPSWRKKAAAKSFESMARLFDD